MPTLVGDEGKVTNDGIKEIKLFAVCLNSQPNRTLRKWDQRINFVQEEVNRQMYAHEMPCTKGCMCSVMSMKKMQDEIKAENSSLVKNKGDTLVHDGIRSNLEVNMTDEKNVKAVDC